MVLIAVAGLPGSGKSALMDDFAKRGFLRYDDINVNWSENLPKAKTDVQSGADVIISDIMFCVQSWRERLESELGTLVQWIFFENSQWRCAKNCLYRFMFEKPCRPLEVELRNIRELSSAYTPCGDVRPVMNVETEHGLS